MAVVEIVRRHAGGLSAVALVVTWSSGFVGAELADRADVSLTTVKWHLQNLYGKLGVGSRAAALSRARALNLLPR